MLITGKRHDFRRRLRSGLRRAGPHPRADVDARVALRLLGRPVRPGERPRAVPLRQRLLPRARRSRLASLQDAHGVEHRVPRLRRAAGHVRDRAHHRRHRAHARPRSARRAARQFLRHRASATSRTTARRSRTTSSTTIVDQLGASSALSRSGAARSPRGTQAIRVIKRGIALTPVKFGISFNATHYNQAGALVHVYTDGTVLLNHGGTEMGQGLHTKVAQVVATELGVPLSAMRVTATDTRKVPNTSATAASSGSDLNGKAAQAAARTIRERLVECACRSARRAAGSGAASPTARVTSERGASPSASSCARRTRRASRCRPPASTARRRSTGIARRCTGRPFFYFAYGAAVSRSGGRHADRRNAAAARGHPARRRHAR